jgi:hypothetical protein
MHSIPSGWLDVLSVEHTIAANARIAGIDHYNSDLFSVRTHYGAFGNGTIGIGNCVAKEINLVLKPNGEFPRMAEISLSIRPETDLGSALLHEYTVVGMYNIPALGLKTGVEYTVILEGITYKCVAGSFQNGDYTFVFLQSDMFQLIEYPEELHNNVTVEFKLLKDPGTNNPKISIYAPLSVDWMAQGKYYIDTRDVDEVTGLMTIHGYDAMLKAEEKFLTDDDIGSWPRTTHQVVANIASRLGVVYDTGFAMNGYMVSYPGDLTMREVLGHIAAAHGGNWVITDSNWLRLIPFSRDTGSIDIGNRAVTLDTSDSVPSYTGVRVFYDDEHAFFSGTEENVLEVEIPWATQIIADNILRNVSGYIYKPFKATGAMLPFGSEIGDTIKVGNITSRLWEIDTTYDALCASDISAPFHSEIDHEFPYMTKQARALKRKVSLGQSYYGTKISRANGLEVTKTEADGSEKSRVKLNSDILAFYNDDGAEALYFDASVGRYRFRGDVEITGGTMNINNNFVVDEEGNLTLKGNINLSEGKITWGQNYPGGGGLTEDEVEEIASTVITSELVAAPTIKAAKFYGGEFIGSFKGEEFTVDSEDSSGSFNLYGKFQNDKYHFFEISYYEGEGPYIHIDSPGGGFMYLGGNASALRVESAIYFNGVVDFSNATVIGL